MMMVRFHAPKVERYDGAKLREIRARHGVGRPPGYLTPAQRDTNRLVESFFGGPPYTVVPRPMHDAVDEHGSQRAAARALGIALSTLQGRLKKEALL